MSDTPKEKYLLSCDWGTSTFRLRLVQREPVSVVAEVRSDQGAQRLAAHLPPRREARYREVLGQARRELSQRTDITLQAVPTLISGMASATIGWRELPYVPVPVPLAGEALLCTEVDKDPVTVLVSGICTATEVMRGEETEILGLMSLSRYEARREAARLILPGTHSKHVRVEQGSIADFVTHMTGELWGLLTEQSTLSYAATPETWRQEPESSVQESFTQGVRAAQEEPLTSLLFQVRAHQVLLGWEGAANAAYLRGVLLGAELGALGREGSANSPILLCAGPQHTAWYAKALEVLGGSRRLTVVPEATMNLAATLGHIHIARALGL
ncbi:MAG: 2-dehydro-3-deoxygalactonokinase [candidate division WS1 bacterium]|nr:2-dehydro-3-deoxygalactonokinase [candidate division WS1 bacterium]